MRGNEFVSFEADEQCPALLSLAVAVQGIVITLPTSVLYVITVVLGAGGSERYLSWAVFSALIICGVATAMQAGRMGRFGAGHFLMMGVSGAFIAVSVLALAEGGPAMLASLIIASSLLQFVAVLWLPRLRRIVTPVVSGTALMLIAITVIPIAFAKVTVVPVGTSHLAGLAPAAATLVTIVALTLLASGLVRLWAMPLGITAGCIVAVPFGLYDVRRALDAPWFALPDFTAWPGIELTPGPKFWGLLPMFVIVSLVAAVKLSSDGAVIQEISRRAPRAIDYRLVQGTINVGALSMLVSGLAGTLPPTGYSPGCVALVNLTGVASRSVGYVFGAMLVLLAAFPKTLAIMLTIPDAVVGAFLLMIMGMLVVEGMRMVVQDGLEPRKALVAGLALTLGLGLESQDTFKELLGETWGTVFGSGMVVGVLVAVLLNAFIELASPRRKRLKVELDLSSLPKINAFLNDLATGKGWNDAATKRLCAAGEETLSAMLQLRDVRTDDTTPRLTLTVRPGHETLEMEFMANFGEENIEDRLAYLGEHGDNPDESEISFRLLRHYAASVRHRKYHGMDVVTVQVTVAPQRAVVAP